MEGQVARYKTAAENAERVEDELKAEKRKLQREVTVNVNCHKLAVSLCCRRGDLSLQCVLEQELPVLVCSKE